MFASEYNQLLERLKEFYNVDAAMKWMRLPHPQLAGRRPIDCRYEDVLQVIHRLDSGAYL